MAITENILFLMDNAADRGATIAATSEVSGMPATNLLDPQRTKVYRSVGIGTKNIDISLPAGEPINPIECLAVVDHNLQVASTATFTVQAWTDGINGSCPVYNEIEAAWPGVPDGWVPPAGLRPIAIIKLGAPVNARYWRISCSSLSSYFQAGRVYVGSAWQPEHNYSYGLKITRLGRTKMAESRGGQSYGNPRPARKAMTMSLDTLTLSERQEFYKLCLGVEDHTPFIACSAPIGTGPERLFTAIYGRFEQTEFEHDSFQNHLSPLRIVEVL